jgi:hypothetical protein
VTSSKSVSSQPLKRTSLARVLTPWCSSSIQRCMCSPLESALETPSRLWRVRRANPLDNRSRLSFETESLASSRKASVSSTVSPTQRPSSTPTNFIETELFSNLQPSCRVRTLRAACNTSEGVVLLGSERYVIDNPACILNVTPSPRRTFKREDLMKDAHQVRFIGFTVFW